MTDDASFRVELTLPGGSALFVALFPDIESALDAHGAVMMLRGATVQTFRPDGTVVRETYPFVPKDKP